MDLSHSERIWFYPLHNNIITNIQSSDEKKNDDELKDELKDETSSIGGLSYIEPEDAIAKAGNIIPHDF